MIFRQATMNDLDDIMVVINEAIAFLKECGIDQWQNGNPNINLVIDDINNGRGHVLVDEEGIYGYVDLLLTGEPTYDVPVSGAFKYNEPYATMHRTAISNRKRGMGLASFMINECAKKCKELGYGYIRIDTHHDNKRMRHVIEREGFEAVAEIILTDGTYRIAYEKKLED